MVSKPGENSQYGPTNEKTRPGIVKYLNNGADFVIKQRREDAYKQMHAACNGKYKMLGEGPNSEGGTASSVGGAVFYDSYQYWYIQFQCE